MQAKGKPIKGNWTLSPWLILKRILWRISYPRSIHLDLALPSSHFEMKKERLSKHNRYMPDKGVAEIKSYYPRFAYVKESYKACFRKVEKLHTYENTSKLDLENHFENHFWKAFLSFENSLLGYSKSNFQKERTNRVSHLCIWCVLTCLYYDEPKPFKASSMLMLVTYTGKPMSLGDMDQDNHTAMIVHTI